MTRHTPAHTPARTLAQAIALALALAYPHPAHPQPSPTLLTLTADATSAPAHTLIHLTALLYSPSSPTGTATFADNSVPLVTIPIDSHGVAVLGIATLPAGPHTLTATYSGDPSSATATSLPISLNITPLPASLTLSAPSATIYATNPLTFTATPLPASATGTLTFTSSSGTSATLPIAGASTPHLQTFGDSITAATPGYASLLATSLGLTLLNAATPAATACDILPTQVLPATLDPTQAAAPLASLMTGTYDTLHSPNPTPTFTACLQSTLAWLAIPREYKIPSTDPSILTTGTWQVSPAFDTNTYATLFNSSGSGTARIQVTSTGQPVYLWYLLADSFPGTFTLALDGVSTGIIYATQPTPPLGSSGIGYALLRFPVAAGVHALDLTVRSGTVGILAAATPPSPGVASVHPTLLVSDLPNQNPSNAATIASYSNNIQSSISLLQSDTLDIRPVPTHSYLTGDPSEFTGPINPSPLGQQHLAAAFQALLTNTPTIPFAFFSSQPTSATLTFSTPGTYTVQAAYPGDSTYAAASSPSLNLTVQPQADSSITLSTLQTRYTTRTAIPFTAVVTPSTATGSVTFYEGTTYLAQSTLNSGAAAFSTNSLTPGLHSLTAIYSGDSPDTPSSSPSLTVQVNRFSPTLNLSPLPATIPANSSQLLTAAILPLAATGPVTFTDSFQAPGQPPASLPLGTSNLASGTATLALSSLAVGTHTVTAAYPGDDLDLPATSSAITFQVLQIPSSTSLLSASPSMTHGSPATLTASVSPASATGTVTLRDSLSGSIFTAALMGGTATFQNSTLAIGPHTFTALYPGDANTAASSSQPVALQVTASPTATNLLPPPATLLAGSPLALTASVSPAGATGTILFSDTATGNLGQSAITGGTATLALPSLPVGAHSLIATYSGDLANAPSASAPAAILVSLHPTTLTLAPLPPTLPLGAPLTLIATASSSATGPITFTDSATSLGVASLANGTASLTLSTLAAGPHTLQASYPGDPLNAPASSAPISLTIAPDSTATTVSLAQVSLPAGSLVTFNVRVDSPLTSIPAGTVTIRSGTLVLATGPLANSVPGKGYATLTASTTGMPLGSYPVTATYLGSLADSPSTSAPATFNVVPIPTVVSVSLSRTPIPLQTTVTLTASVTSTSQTPTGTLTFLANGSPIATLPLDPTGSAAATFLPHLPGAYAISSAYAPTGLFAPATAPPQILVATLPIALTVNPTALSIASASAQSATLTIMPLSGFTGPVATSCFSANAFITCSVDSPAAITAPTPLNAVVHIHVSPSYAVPRTATALAVTSLLLLPLLFARRRLPALLACLLALLTLQGCAEGGTFGAIPPGSYAVTITATAGGSIIPATLAITIPPNPAVK